MEDLLSLAAWFIIELVIVGTGNFVVRVASFGRWRGERITEREGRIYSAAGSLSFLHNGTRVVTHTGLLFVGIIFYILLAIGLLVIQAHQV